MIEATLTMSPWPNPLIRDAAALAQLYEGRDLKPTSDLRAVAKGVIADLFGISALALGRDIFPQTAHLAPHGGLIT